MARVGVVAERAAHLDLLAQRPQRVLPPGTRPHRRDAAAVPGGRPGLAATGRQHDAVHHGPLPAQHRPREPHRRRQAAAPAVPRRSRRRTQHCATGRGRLGRGPAAVLTTSSPTSCWRAPATSRRRRRWPPRSCCASTCPTCRVRFVNVVDLMALLPENDHPHGYADSQFDDLFTTDKHVVFAFHGYPRAIHQLIHGRSNPGRFHVRGFSEQGTTTTPFDMVVLNRMCAISTWRRRCCGGPAVGPTGGTSCGGYCAAPARRARALHPRAPRGPARRCRLDLAWRGRLRAGAGCRLSCQSGDASRPGHLSAPGWMDIGSVSRAMSAVTWAVVASSDAPVRSAICAFVCPSITPARTCCSLSLRRGRSSSHGRQQLSADVLEGVPVDQ